MLYQIITGYNAKQLRERYQVENSEIRDCLSVDQLEILGELSDVDTELIYKEIEYRERKETYSDF